MFHKYLSTPLALSLALSALLPLGCDEPAPDPLIGDWKSAERIAGEFNEMEIEGDLEGEATIRFFVGESPFFADFDVTAEAQGGGDYELDFECQGGCSELDFTAECEMDGDELECEGDNGWENYEFAWEVD